jgi:16S rRNA C967 or C1407 C5-methylase (RsmB/RsmF family)
MAAPSAQLVRFSQRLLSQPDQRDAFLAALTQPQPDAPTILWTRPRPPRSVLEWTPLPPVPWQPDFVDRLPVGTRPGRHPLHEQGNFYCLDLSSIFAASVVQAISPTPKVVIDLCAAPGGKSLYLWAALQPAVLLCNEVIRKRVKILIANLKRCGITQARVMNLDPAAMVGDGRRSALRDHRDPDSEVSSLAYSADLVLVDAPCSGQSLLAKGQKVPGCFHPVTLKRNASRQKRILAAAASLVRPGGHLAYMTCTYAPEENEQVGRWLMKKFPAFQPVAVPYLADYQSPLSDWPCYRLWPHLGLGAGAFTSLWQRQATDDVEPQPVSQDFIAQHSFEIYGSGQGETEPEAD